MTAESEVRPSGFGVYVDQPYQIWQSIRDNLLSRGNYKNITQLMKDPNRTNATYVVSKTDFGSNSPLLEEETTELEIQVQNWGPFCEIGSTLSLGERTINNHLLAFYSTSRLRYLGDILKNMGFMVTQSFEGTSLDGVNGYGHLTIGKKNEVYVQVNMGPTTPEFALAEKNYRLEFLTKRLPRLENIGVPQLILDYEIDKLAQAQNANPADHPIELKLTNYWKKEGGKGSRMISFRDHETFIRNLYFYSAVYQSLLEAIYQERSLALPQEAIVIAQPKLVEN